MSVVNVHEAKTHLSRLIDRVPPARRSSSDAAGKPVARLVPLAAPQRTFGSLRGQVWMADDFDDDLGLADLFEGAE